ncbi:ATP synthase subunit C lysine N-methyltransferase isoform X2 [Balaenoptera acutorostrata]|uniref:ATP synthase subunit C lysine N-methyltransferase isoform X2 n=1 Tax=Balaenoptera acutorostrata TaxID=9767 RepID=A0A452CLD0_BALAC|nr:ATP synthase subunit C lysine N-methyltransferase isoform X2 [Balaenoptera acutorostrata]
MEGGGTPPETLKEERQSGCVPPTSPEGNSLKKSNWGFLVTGIVGGTLVAVYAVATPFITPALRRICLPFVPATAKQIENVVKMLRCRRGPLVDIGSGDGRIVIAAAKEGFTAVGYELNPWLVWYSRYCARRDGVQASAKFYISDLWKVTFSQYSNVVIFGVPQMVLLILRCTIAVGKEKKNVANYNSKTMSIVRCILISGMLKMWKKISNSDRVD